MLQREKCVLITGAGGTGKSMLINHIVRTLRGRRAKVAVMAHTGVAAVTVGGQTTWSFMQFSPELLAGTKEAAAATLKKRKTLVDQFKTVRAIVIDEVSMMDPIEIEFMDHIVQVCRGIYRPFGGVQIVLVGDFYQLPPVEDRARKPMGSRRFIFQSDAFWRGIAEMHELTEAFRQTDEVFIGVLHRVRRGKQTLEDLALLRSRIGAPLACEERSIVPTRLYAKNRDVASVNERPGGRDAAVPPPLRRVREGSRRRCRQARQADRKARRKQCRWRWCSNRKRRRRRGRLWHGIGFRC